MQNPIVPAILASSMLLFSAPSRAEQKTVVAFDANRVGGASEADVEGGWGGALRGGPRFDLTLLTLTTELAGNIDQFGGDAAPTAYRGMIGGRIGILTILRPSAFAHLGVGHADFDDTLTPARRDVTNFAADMGLALDFTLLPLIDVGVHGAYNTIVDGADTNGLSWLNLGAHVEFVFDD